MVKFIQIIVCVTGGVTSTEKKVREEQYIYSEPQLHHDDTIKMDANPSYGSSYTGQRSNIAIQPNPSNDVRKLKSENKYEFSDMTFEPNPSYDVATRMGTNAKSSDVAITPNPAYGSVKTKK